MIITTTSELAEVCRRCAANPFVTLDTEFIREKTYYPELCLIQLATPDEAVCIDPLAPGLDLSPLFDLLQDQNVTKVFHAARQDIEIFYHLTGQIPTPLFDTQIAAMVCGYGDNVGYQQLVSDITGVTLDKSMRFTDWSYRPLSAEQITYALHDVTYLRDIYIHFRNELKSSGREAWLAEELEQQNNPATYETDNDDAWQRFKTPFKKPRQITLFARLCAWREETAKQKNRPRRHILKDEALIELAACAPTEPKDFDALRNLPNGLGRSAWGKEILAVIAAAQSEPVPERFCTWKPQKPLTATQHNMADLFRLLLSVVCADLKVAPRIIATTEDLGKLARGDKDIPCMKGWRKEVFGDKALLFKQGKLALKYNPNTRRVDLMT